MISDMSCMARFSEQRTHRYTLWRGGTEDSARYCMFIGLNPSTADETRDDPTIRRCKAFAKSFGYDALCMTNLFGYRATDPYVMKSAADPVGPDNDEWLLKTAGHAGLIIAAWGMHGEFMDRDIAVIRLLKNHDLHALKLTMTGQPAHPLYLRADVRPFLIGSIDDTEAKV